MTVESVISFYDCDLLAVHGAFPMCVLFILCFIWVRRAQRERTVLCPTCQLVVTPRSSCLRPRIVLTSCLLHTQTCHGGQGWVFVKFLPLQCCRIPEFHPHTAPSPSPSHPPTHSHQQTHPLAPSTTTHGSGEIHNHSFCTVLPLGEREHRVLYTLQALDKHLVNNR